MTYPHIVYLFDKVTDVAVAAPMGVECEYLSFDIIQQVFLPLATSCGSNVPALSRGVLISTSPSVVLTISCCCHFYGWPLSFPSGSACQSLFQKLFH
jgi:hypothetical protein